MQIKTKNLHEWIKARTTIRYRGELYKANYNGNVYFMLQERGTNLIPFYKIKRGVWGLETNRKNV